MANSGNSSGDSARASERPTEPIAIEDALPNLEAGVSSEEVDAAVADRDLDLGIFTDEELHWLADRESVPNDELEAPRLSAVPADQQEAMAEGALWVMMARGDIEVDNDDQVRAIGRHGLLSMLREEPPGVARIEFGTREDGPSYAALYYVTANATMIEMVNPAGLHHFLITVPTRAATVLLDLVAPDEISGETTEGQRVSKIEELTGLDELVDNASRSSLIVTGRSTEAGDVEQASSTLYVVDNNLHLLSGWTGQFSGEGEVTLQQLGYNDAIAWAIWAVTDAMRPEGA